MSTLLADLRRNHDSGFVLALVNNLQMRDELPLATPPNLRMVLEQLGAWHGQALPDACDQPRGAIAAWEKPERHTPSWPRFYVVPLLAQKPCRLPQHRHCTSVRQR